MQCKAAIRAGEVIQIVPSQKFTAETDISPLALYRALGAVSRARLVASGGVSSLDDVRALRDAGLYGAIIGKAYYTGAIDLRRALEVAV